MPTPSPLGKLKLTTKLIADLTPANYNPRTISIKAKQGLSNSITEFGLVQPIIWNKRTNNIVGGHQRLNDLIQRNVIETDVVEVDLPLNKEKALNVTLNSQTISGTFDEDMLSNLLNDIEDTLIKNMNLDSIIDIQLPEFDKKRKDEKFFSNENDIHTENTCPKCNFKW